MTPPRPSARAFADHVIRQLEADSVPWQHSFTDGFTIGDPNTEVRGVAVVFKPTLDVLRRAAALDLNFIISHEAAFWEAFDPPQIMTDDPVRRAKTEFVEANGTVVWRLHDHLHRMQPEPVFAQLLSQLGWATGAVDDRIPPRVEISEIQLGQLSAQIQTALKTRNVSVVGDPAMPVRSVGFGIHVLSTILPALRSADVAIVGETAEYDSFEYVRDAAELGLPKGLIRIAHERLEVWGVRGFAEWLSPRSEGLPVAWLPTGDPFDLSGTASDGGR